MNKMTLGTTDIEASRLSLGTWAIGGGDSWGPSDEGQSILCIQTALDCGINYLDTAPAYGQGYSEEVVGKATQGHRHDYVIATKCGLVWGDGQEGSVHKQRDGETIRRNLSPKSIRAQVEDSLRRLKTDYIDVLITHWQSIEPFFTPIAETVAMLETLKQEGKIRSYGASNVTEEHIHAYQLAGDLTVVQQKFSLLDRKCQPLIDCCKAEGITFQAYSPLERGILTGNVTMDTPIVGTAKASIPWYQPENRQRVLEAIETLKPLCETYGCTFGNLVIACTSQLAENMNVLCGARTPQQIKENALAGSILLRQEDVRHIEETLKALTI